MADELQTVTIAGCNTAAKLFAKRVTELAAKVALREKDLGIWNEYSWTDYGEQAMQTGSRSIPAQSTGSLKRWQSPLWPS